MRKILMSERGEFKKQEQTDYIRATAVKMMASVIKKPDHNDEEVEVMNSNKALQRVSR